MNARLMGRAAAGVGALVAAGAVTLVVVGGTANAAGAGRCTDNVNVREKPDITSQIVAVCERGQAVQVGKTRNGFVQLTDLDGWAAQEYVSVDGHTPAAPTTRTTAAAGTTATTATTRTTDDGTARTHHSDDASGHAADSTSAATPTDEADPADDTDPTMDQPQPAQPAQLAVRLTGAAGRARRVRPAGRCAERAPRRTVQNRATTASQTRDASSAFDPDGSTASLPSAPSSHPALSATSNAVPSPTALTTSRSQPLRASLARP